ncbi:MAG: crotonase/enoyl-CoA hydratase family protein [Acidimicrobiia bacterium]
MTDVVLLERQDGVAQVALNRPDKLNALDLEVLHGLVGAAEAVAADPSVRAVVLTGRGRGFFAGLDRTLLAAMAGARSGATPGDAPAGGAGTDLAQRAVRCWRELAVPVVAALHGPVLGGGLQVALGADLRVVHPDASLGILELRWGLVPDMGATEALPRLVGLERAKDLVLTARTLSGTEAVAIGLASRTATDPLAAATELAHELSRHSPGSLAAAKRLLEASADRTVEAQLAAERAEIGALVGSPDQVEAVAAQIEGRAPRYR